MKISSIEVREISLTRRTEFISSRARVNKRRILLITVKDSDGCEGWGECSAPEEPRYCEEWTNSAWEMINTILAPLLLSKAEVVASDVRHYFDPYRGNRMAKGAVEAACWDLEARRRDKPLWQVLGGTSDPIPCGVALGILGTVDELIERVRVELDSGYRRVKLKIGPGWDVDVMESVREKFPRATLMVDANGAYRTEDLDTLRALDRFELLMIEQPFAPDDLWAYREVKEQLLTPVCLDETIVSVLSATAAVLLQLCRVINVKVGRVGGHAEGREIINFCAQHEIPTWCGAQHEAGIGRAHSIALATLTGRELPSEISASERYWAEDIIIPEITVGVDGYMSPPMGPGFGFEVNRPLVNAATQRSIVHRQ
jgi:o-succinylbenzoate synthase